jgi:hypothetical protein
MKRYILKVIESHINILAATRYGVYLPYSRAYHNAVLSSFITYHQVGNKSNMTGATRRTGTSYSSGAARFTTDADLGVSVVSFISSSMG